MKAAIILGAFGLATVLSACGGSDQAQATYCVDANGTVLDEDYCDPDNDNYNPTFIYWYSYDDDHHYKTGKKIPGGDFRKGTTSAPAKSSSKPSAGSTSKPSTASSKPSVNSPKASAPKAQTPKPAPAPKAQAPKPAAPPKPASPPKK